MGNPVCFGGIALGAGKKPRELASRAKKPRPLPPIQIETREQLMNVPQGRFADALRLYKKRNRLSFSETIELAIERLRTRAVSEDWKQFMHACDIVRGVEKRQSRAEKPRKMRFIVAQQLDRLPRKSFQLPGQRLPGADKSFQVRVNNAIAAFWDFLRKNA